MSLFASLNFEQITNLFVVMWAVIDPIGTVPVFIAVTKNYTEQEKKRIATTATLVATGVLLFFIVLGESILKQVGVPLAAFRISGGIILFLFAIDMIFGNSKPETEVLMVKTAREAAIFPLAIPSIAGPGAILAVVLMTESYVHSFLSQLTTVVVLIIVMGCNLLIMRSSGIISKRIGDTGTIIVSKVMGLILASIAANHTLVGLKQFFN